MMKSTTLFPEGGSIDRIDKNLSLYVFTLDFGYFFEVLLTMPGMWFGIPLTALGIVPLFTATLVDPELLGPFMAIGALSLLSWGYLVHDSMALQRCSCSPIPKHMMINSHDIFQSQTNPSLVTCSIHPSIHPSIHLSIHLYD